MADQWTVTSADADTITVEVTIDGITREWVLGHNDVDLSNEADLLTTLRDFATQQRAAILDAQTPPAVVNLLVGHSEDF